MGYYINPTDSTKEQWLNENGQALTAAPVFGSNPDHTPVCLADNGPFTAAGICYSEQELQAFNDPGDHRRKQWFWVSNSKLAVVCPEVANRIDQ